VNSPRLIGTQGEFLEGGGQTGGVVAAGVVVGGHLGVEDGRPELGEGPQLAGRGGRVLGPLAEHGGHRQARAVVEDGGQVGLGREAAGLPRLGLQVADVDQPLGLGQGRGQVGDEQVGHDRGEGRPGAEQDQVGLADGVDRGRHGGRGARLQPHRLDPAAGRGDRHLALDLAAVDQAAQPHRHQRGRQDLPLDPEPPRRLLQRLLEAALEVGQGGQGQVAQVVAGQVAALEPVAEQLADLGRRVGQGEHGLAQVAGGQQAQVAAEPPRGAAVVGHGHHRGRGHPEQPQGGQGDGQAVAAPERDDPHSRSTSRWATWAR
jgi:hypothetical protein